jgi:cytochrome b561
MVDSPGKKWTSYGEVLWTLHWMTLLAFVVLLVVAVGGTAKRARAAPCTAVSCWTPLREVRVDAGKLGV